MSLWEASDVCLFKWSALHRQKHRQPLFICSPIVIILFNFAGRNEAKSLKYNPSSLLKCFHDFFQKDKTICYSCLFWRRFLSLLVTNQGGKRFKFCKRAFLPVPETYGLLSDNICMDIIISIPAVRVRIKLLSFTEKLAVFMFSPQRRYSPSKKKKAETGLCYLNSALFVFDLYIIVAI